MEATGKKDRKSATIEGYLRDIANECSREELKRLFYVAATRPRKRLYLSAAVPDGRQPDSNSMLRLLWDVPGLQSQLLPQEPLPQEPQPELTTPLEPNTATLAEALPELLLRRLPESFAMPAAPQPLQWSFPQRLTSGDDHRFEWVGDLLPRVGVVAHGFLQRIAIEGPSAWDAARLASATPAIASALSRAGVVRSELEQGIARVVQALRNTLSDPQGLWLLSPHEESRCEFAVSAAIAGRLEHVRVDRTFIEDGTRWLIDYKITEQLGGDRSRFLQMQVDKYRPDMDRYVRVLRAFDPRPIRCALYLPLLGEFCPVE
jgi:ATP-dependent exoDNAse (exonuclease V) beta subunit